MADGDLFGELWSPSSRSTLKRARRH